MYRHRWGAPAFARTRRGSYIPSQECRVCGATRNPLTGAIVKRRGSACWNAEPGERDLVAEERQVDRLREELRTLELAGERVQWDHGPRAKANANHPSFL